jgi:CRP-like cAMP-binding protein
LSDKLEGQHSIAKRIVDGSVTIDSVEEFEKMLKISPNDPSLHRAFGDLLARQKRFDAAADTYGTAAELFIDAGIALQAIVSKILQWRIIQPSHQEGRAFHSALCECGPKETPLQHFLTQMAYPEMVAFMVKLVRVNRPAGKIVQKFGDMEKDIYFVVSGALKETTYHPLEEGEKVSKRSTRDLVGNDFFGNIYPFEAERVSRSYIETITQVELVKTSKPRLVAVCRKYPNVEGLVKGLYSTRMQSDEETVSPIVRKNTRHQLPTKVNMKIFREDEGKSPVVFTGFADDISLGGARIVLGAKYHTGSYTDIIGRNVKVEMDLPTVGVKLNILGTTVWGKEVSHEGKTTTAVGVQFKDLPDHDHKLLEDYCYGSDGEQNLILSLWESLVKQ